MASKKSKPKKAAAVSIRRANLIATVRGNSRPANIQIEFFQGMGQATVVLFRNGALINMQSVSSNDTVRFSDVQSRDTIAVNGVCAGRARITIDLPTRPTTPENFTKVIITGYTIL